MTRLLTNITAWLILISTSATASVDTIASRFVYNHNSDITLQGSQLIAGNTASLDADGDIHLLAAQNQETSKTSFNNDSVSVGATVAAGGQQTGVSFQIGYSDGRGDSQSTLTTWQESLIHGAQVNLTSGHDLELIGAQVHGEHISVDVGGDLIIESVQDTYTFESDSNSGGINLSICIPPICYGSMVTASAHYNQSDLDVSIASVQEQSGLFAGSQGFDVNVEGHTTLIGGVISSSQEAIDNGLNHFDTATLSVEDIENTSTVEGAAYAVSGSVSSDPTPDQPDDNKNGSVSVGPPGVGEINEQLISITASGISAGNHTIRDNQAQQSLTGQSSEQTLASLNTTVTTETADAKASNGHPKTKHS